MNCERVKELLFQYINNELDEVNVRMIREHLTECDECKKEYELLLGMSEAIKESRYEAPEELRDRVMSAVKTEKIRKNRERIIRRIAYVAASAAAFVIAINAIFNAPAFNKGNKAPSDEKNDAVSDRVPAETPQGGSVQIKADTVFSPIDQENYSGEDLLLTHSTLKSFKGEWQCELEGGWRLTMQVYEDGSVVVCIEDRFGLENYYDGSLTFDNGKVYLDQSNGNSVCHATVEMAIKSGRLYMDVVKGSTPWIEVT